MANLIPPAARKSVTFEYWSRVISVWLFLIGTGLIMVTLLQIPTYVLIKDQLIVFDSWYQEVSSSNEQFQDSIETITETNSISRFINADTEQLLFTTLVDELNALATREIEISAISVKRTETGIGSMEVSGQAATRSSLADYRSAIESSDQFETAALPLSNLAKESNIPFRISVTVPQTDEESES